MDMTSSVPRDLKIRNTSDAAADWQRWHTFVLPAFFQHFRSAFCSSTCRVPVKSRFPPYVFPPHLQPAAGVLWRRHAENHQELLYTLYVYLRESQKAIKAAEILCIHKNTLFYRLRKIREITGIDLDRGDEVLHLQISFLILRYEGELMA